MVQGERVHVKFMARKMKTTNKKKEVKTFRRLFKAERRVLERKRIGCDADRTEAALVECIKAIEATQPEAQAGRCNEKEDRVDDTQREDQSEEEPRIKKLCKTLDKKLDLFAIPSSSCDATVFSIQQPFVDVVFSNNFKPMEGDKVRDGQSMDAKVLKIAIDAISKEYLLASKSSNAPTLELANRDLHVTLAKSFWRLTRPRKLQRLNVLDILALNQHKSEERVNGPEELTELGVVSDEVDARDPICSELKGRLSNDSIDVRLEGDERECHEKANKQTKYDIKFQVYDESIKGIDKTVVVLLVECKWGSFTVEDIYQVAAHACEIMKKNLQKGSFNPLHLEVWNESSWRYAILHPTGLVVVKDKKVAEVKVSNSKPYLTSRLENRKLNTKYSVFEYPDGEYLEGVLFVSNETYALPGLWLIGSLMTADSQLFYQSKLRILIGDRVLNWTFDDVENALRVRGEALDAEHAMLMDG